MPPVTLPLDKGVVTGRDVSLLEPGELQEGEGVVYKPSDPAAHKQGGRTLFNASAPASAASDGIQFIDFDSASDLLTTQINGVLYSSTVAGASFGSIRTGLTAGVHQFDLTKFGDNAFCCNGTDTNFVVLNNNTTIRHGLDEITTAPTSAFIAGALTGTYIYWTTEVDNTNGVESAFSGTGLTVAPSAQGIRITKPATANTSATHWRVYRTKTLGSFPIGWRVATVAIGTTTYDDTTADADLVLLTAYPIVTINSVSESRDREPPVFKSIATYEGSMVGVADRTVYYSETAQPHSFPASYTMPLRPRFGGLARCVRPTRHGLLVWFDNDLFRVNYLPKEADAFFDTGIAQEHIANFGTPSPLGACVFSGWGGQEMAFFASLSGPMITDGESVDRAVKGIDWAGTVPLSVLGRCVVHDVPDEWCVNFYYQSDAGSASTWRLIKFYYDPYRIRTEAGFPELVWTGPHRVPGPGTYAVVSGDGRVYTGSKSTSGSVYQEDSGTEDAADLVDSSGTINFRLRTGRFYPAGIDGETRASRVYVHKASAGTGSYTVVTTGHYEEATAPTGSRTVTATTQGASSESINLSGQSFDVRVTRDDTAAMPAINNLHLVVEDASALEKPG